MAKKAKSKSDRSPVDQSESQRQVPRGVWLFLLVVILIAIAIGYLYNDYNSTIGEQVQATYVGRTSCIECHQQQADLFHGSHHDRAMDLATEETVLGKFDGTEIEHYGVTSRVFRDQSKFMINTEGPDGQMTDFQVKYVFGVEPLQQYMVEMQRDPDASEDEIGQVQVLRISWDTEREKWFYLKPPDVDEKIEPDDPLHWTGITQRWNLSCADCHSTDLKKNYNDKTRHYRTTFSEIDVSCESCHGPGSVHVQLARNKGVFWDKKLGMGLTKLKTESNLPQIESCAPCHSRRTITCNGFQAGERFDDFFACQLLSDQMYHDDGQIRDEDYVYGSFIQSKMFHKGIRCTDCHDPHSTKLKFKGNQVCTSCHQHPAGKYDTPSHHQHTPGTEGAACVSCHMPSTTYMDVDARRDHSFRVPRPDLSVRFGTPNACTSCHLDQTKLPAADQVGLSQYLDWIIQAENGNQNIKSELKRIDEQMLAAVQKWYPAGTSSAPTKYYESLTVGKSEAEQAMSTLIQLATDSESPAMFRATALEEMVFDATPETLAAAVAALDDADPKVVAAALGRIQNEVGRVTEYASYDVGQLSKYEQQLRPLVRAVMKLTDHPVRRVRIESARVAASFSSDLRGRVSTSDQRRAFDLAIGEYKDSLKVENDRAGNHMMLGSLHELMGDSERAIAAYRTAIRIEPNMAGPRTNLSALLGGLAEQLQRQMQSAGNRTTAGQLQTTLEQIRSYQVEATELRAKEYELLKVDLHRARELPNTHALHYRFALSSYLRRDFEATEKHMLLAHEQAPENPTYLLGLATYYRELRQLPKAVKYVNQLVQMDPEHPGYRNLAAELSKEIENQIP